jgi:hypothetical protein
MRVSKRARICLRSLALPLFLLAACTPPAPPVSLVVSAEPSAVAGAAIVVTVTVVDKRGVTVADFTGPIAISSSDPLAQLPAQYTFAPKDSGQHAFALELRTAGAQLVMASDPILPLTGQATVSVSAGAAAQLTLTAPANITSGVDAMATAAVFDAFMNPARSYAGTLSFTSSDPRAQLPPAHPFSVPDAGAFRFSFALLTAGTQTLTASDATGTLKATASIQLLAASAQRIAITGLPASAIAGAPQAVTVTAYDGAGNIASGYRGTLSFTSSDSQAVLAAPYTFTAADAGVHVAN